MSGVDITNIVTPECQSEDDTFYSARRSAVRGIKTPSTAWKTYRNSSVFLSCSKWQSATPEETTEKMELHKTQVDEQKMDFSDIGEDLCIAMNDLVLSQKKRIERSQKKKANDPKFDKSHEMLTRSDPRIDVYELRSRSIPRKSLFPTEGASSNKSRIRYRTTPHVNKSSRKMLHFSPNSDNSVSGDCVDHEKTLDIDITPTGENDNDKLVQDETIKLEDDKKHLVPQIDPKNSTPMPTRNIKSVKFAGFENDVKVEQDVEPSDKMIKTVKQPSNILKDITTTAVGMPNVTRAKPKTKVKPFSFEKRDQEFLKRKQERIKLGEELNSKPTDIIPIKLHPVPNFQRRQTLVPNQIANKPKPTVPVAFQFRSALRATKKLTGDHDQVEKDQLKKMIEEKMKKADKSREPKPPSVVFKARPATVLYKKPFEVQKCTKKLTSPIEPFQK